MKWSWKIAEISGIGIYVHATFAILLVWIGAVYWNQGGPAAALYGLMFLGVLFGTVVLHELGHAFAARRYGIDTRDITLLPIGGVARLERMPDDPREELVVAIAGPAVNVVLAGICLLALMVLVGPAHVQEAFWKGLQGLEFLAGQEQSGVMSRLPSLGIAFFSRWMAVNIVLVVFNLLPAFPMDGGRVLRALLAMRLDYVTATRRAAGIGVLMAFLFGLLGLLGGNPILLFIALFVYMGATSEAALVATWSVLGGIPAGHAMVTEFRVVAPDDTIESVAEHILAGFQQDFPVVDDGRLVGMLTRSDVLHALAAGRAADRVRDVMRGDFERATPRDMLERVVERLRACHCQAMPVVDDGRLVGVIDMENIGEYVAIQSALRPGRAAEGGPTGRSGFRV